MNGFSSIFPDQANATPALLICHPSTANLRVAGLTLADRFVIAAHRAGCHPITVFSNEKPPALERAKGIGIPVEFTSTPLQFNRPVLVSTTSLLTNASDIRLLLQKGGRMADANGTLLTLGLVPQFQGTVESALAQLPIVAAKGVTRPINDAASAKLAESALWDSLQSPADGIIDRIFNRPCGRPLSKLLVRTPVSPNAISLASMFIGLVAAWFFAIGGYTNGLLAALLFQISAVVDCVDGDIARIAYKESALGKWLDLTADQVVHVAVFGGIALGLMQSNPDGPALWLGASAIVGALLSFAVVVRGIRQPHLDSSGRLQKLIDAATSRDFSVLVLMLALVGKLDWFLWLTAAGSHVFWMTALTLQLTGRAATERPQ